MVKGVEYRFSIPKYLGAKTFGKRFPAFTYGALSALRLSEFPAPALRGDRWALLRPILSGICGTDLGIITAKTSTALEPFSSFPAVLGHEVLARVELAGAAVTKVKPGGRVVVDPFLHCAVRELEPCPLCLAGQTSLCKNVARGKLEPGMILGACAGLPGSWSEAMLAHESQLFPVPDALSDRRAALVEPLSVSLHAVLKALPPGECRVLVIGGGSIGLCTVAALRLLGAPAHITLLGRYGFQREFARMLGADETPAQGGALEAASALLGANLYKPTLGCPVTDWGFDVVFDCVGSRASIDDGLRTTRAGGSFVLLGAAGEIPKLDWSFVWSREIKLLGSCGYGREEWQGAPRHTFEVTMELLLQHPEYPVERLITHVYPLAEYQQALFDALHRRESKAVKVAFAAG